MKCLVAWLLASLLSTVAVPLCAAQATKISAPMSFGTGNGNPGVPQSAFTPDGTRVVYLAGQDLSETPELYVAPADGSQPPQKLSGTTASNPRNAVLGFQLGSDGVWAVYHLGGGGLYAVRVDGSAAPISLGATSVHAVVYAITPDGARVVSLQNGATLDVRNLDGSGTPLSLASGDVAALAFTPDASRVLYLEIVRVAQHLPRRLFSAPLDGSAVPVQLSAAVPPQGSVNGFQIDADGARVVYLGDQDVVGRKELYSVPVAGGTPVRLNGPLVANGNVTQFGLSAQTNRVVYVARQERSLPDLYSVPIAGGTPLRLHAPLGATAEVLGSLPPFRIAPDGKRVLFTVRPAPSMLLTLYLANVDGTGHERRIDTTIAGPIAWSRDGQHAVYEASEAPGRNELFSYRLGGRDVRRASLGASAQQRLKLNATLVAGGSVLSYLVTRDHVVYRADQQAMDVNELFAAPIDGSAPAFRLNATLVAGGNVVASPAPQASETRVLYLADGEIDEVRELFAVPIAGGAAVKLNGVLDPGSPYSDVNEVRVSPGGVAVYQESNLWDSAAAMDLHSVDLTTHVVSGLAVPVVGKTLASSTRFGPDGTRIGFLTGFGGSQPSDPLPEALYTARLDGSEPPVRLSPPVVGERVRLPRWAFSPDGVRIAFHSFWTTPQSVVTSELYGVSADGSAPAVLLDTELHAVLLMHPDGDHVAYYAGSQRDLYLARLDGSLAPTLLVDSSVPHGPTQFLQAPFQAQFSADGSRIVFCDALAGTHYDLYSVATAGGSPLQLSGTLVAGGNVQRFELTADGTRAVYLADQDVDGRNELYSVPIDGSSPAVVLSRRPTTQSVRQFLLSPDGTRVAFDQLGLCFAPSDAGAPPTVTSIGLATSSQLGFSPDGAWVVVHDFDRLLSVPTDGSSAGVQVNASLERLMHEAPKFLISADSQRVVYRADPTDSGRVHLYASALDGGSLPVQLDTPQVEFGSVGNDASDPQHEPFSNSYALTADGRALYVADHDRYKVFELYEVALP